MAKLAIFVCFGMMLTFVVEADLDVHCLHKHVRGTWTFHMTEANMDKNGIKCSKGVTQAYGSKSNNYGLGEPNYKPVKTIEVELGKKNVASATIGGKHHKGTWTMIYDEGFEVNINDQTFFCFLQIQNEGIRDLVVLWQDFSRLVPPSQGCGRQEVGLLPWHQENRGSTPEVPQVRSALVPGQEGCLRARG